MIRSISALTLFTADMARSVTFYEKMGFRLHYGGPEAAFTSFFVGTSYLNLTTNGPARPETGWGRAIFHVDDVDVNKAHHGQVLHDFIPKRPRAHDEHPRPPPATPPGANASSTSATPTATNSASPGRCKPGRHNGLVGLPRSRSRPVHGCDHASRAVGNMTVTPGSNRGTHASAMRARKVTSISVVSNRSTLNGRSDSDSASASAAMVSRSNGRS